MGERAMVPRDARPEPRPSEGPAEFTLWFDGTAAELFRLALPLASDLTAAEEALEGAYLQVLRSAQASSWPSRPGLGELAREVGQRLRESRRRSALARHGRRPLEFRRGLPRSTMCWNELAEPHRSFALLRWSYGFSLAEIADLRRESLTEVDRRLREAVRRMVDGPVLASMLARLRERIRRRAVEDAWLREQLRGLGR